MARILSIPDVHGSHQWEAVKSVPKDSYDYIVFHGDYFDSWENQWPDQGENFKAICDFVREDTEHRKLLIGNHDFAYLSLSGISGTQDKPFWEIQNLIKSNLDIIDIAFECDEWIFSHAGFSDTWVQTVKKIFNVKQFSISLLNEQFHRLSSDNNYSGKRDSLYELLNWYGFLSPSGDEISQGPLWIRPESLLQDAYYPKQVVGHTEMCLYEKVFLQQKENRVIVVDSALHEIYSVFDTTAEYDFITIPEFFKWYKRTLKIINDIKSQIFYHKDEDEFIQTSLKEHFSEEIAERLFRTSFGKECK